MTNSESGFTFLCMWIFLSDKDIYNLSVPYWWTFLRRNVCKFQRINCILSASGQAGMCKASLPHPSPQPVTVLQSWGQFGNNSLEVPGPHRLLDSLLDGQRKQRETVYLFTGTRSLSVHTVMQRAVNDEIFLSTLWTRTYLD